MHNRLFPILHTTNMSEGELQWSRTFHIFLNFRYVTHSIFSRLASMLLKKHCFSRLFNINHFQSYDLCVT